MCCLGFYLEACGVRADTMDDLSSPGSWIEHGGRGFPIVKKLQLLKEAGAEWLLGGTNIVTAAQDSMVCNTLMHINDAPHLDEATREAYIKEHFAQHGVGGHVQVRKAFKNVTLLYYIKVKDRYYYEEFDRDGRPTIKWLKTTKGATSFTSRRGDMQLALRYLAGSNPKVEGILWED